MKTILKRAWPLFFGIILLMVGNGLQGTLLGVRATIEDFGTTTTGLVMSLYSAGYLTGCVFAPRLVQNVGHIRVFAALSSLAATMILLHGLVLEPAAWGLIRIVTGFCIAAIYIVIESWLNDMATKETRGKIIAAYLLVLYGAMVMGQYLLNAAPADGMTLFVIASIFISLSLLPIALSPLPTPEFQAPKPTGLREVYKASPLGCAGIFLGGMGNGAFFAMGSVYAMKTGMSMAEIANFMALFTLGGAAGQVPLGLLSDRIERRKLIIAVSFLTAFMTLLCAFFTVPAAGLYLCVFLYGCAALSIYGLCSAYTNDHMRPGQFVGASAALILINGSGALIGPFLLAQAMAHLGTGAFFPLQAFIYTIIGIFGLYRSRIRPAPPVEAQEHFAPPLQATPENPAKD